MLLTMKAATRTAGMPPMARPSTTGKLILPILMYECWLLRHTGGSGSHDRGAQPRVHAIRLSMTRVGA